MTRTNFKKNRDLKRPESRSIKIKQKKGGIEKKNIIKHVKTKIPDIKKDVKKEIKKVEEIFSETESEKNSTTLTPDTGTSDEDSMGYSKMKKPPKNIKNTTVNFAETMNKLLTTSLEPVYQKTPILSRSKGIEREIDEAKLEYKARKAISMEKKKLASKDRVKANLTSVDHERKLRKLATRGVVQLFNAINKSQKIADDAIKAIGGETALTIREARDVTDMTKETFLDILKKGN